MSCVHHVRILYLTEFLSSLGGGGEIAFYNLAKAVATNNEVIMICHESENVQARSASSASGHFEVRTIKPKFELRHGFFPSNFQQIRYIMSLVLAGSNLVRKRKIDIIHANTLSPAIAGGILGLVYKIPVIVTFHHIETPCDENAIGRKPTISKGECVARYFRSLYDKMILALPFSCIHAVSHSTANDLRRIGYRGKLEVVPNGLDFDLYQNLSEGIEYRPYLLFIGRLVKSKNLGIIIEAFAETLRIVPNAMLIVLGDGPMKEIWQKQAMELGIHEHVKFKGYVSEEQKIELLGKCSALVFPSLVEGFGMVILEAFALKKPVIASRISSSIELICHDIDGILLPAFSSETWAKTMTSLLLHTVDCQEMGSAGEARAKARFQIGFIAKQIELVYRGLMKSAVVCKADVMTRNSE